MKLGLARCWRCVMLGAGTASAQTARSPASPATRAGAVMPGVTVEAASPALIEKVRDGRHRRRGPVQDHRPAARHLRRDVHAERASAPSSAGHRADRRLHGAGQRRPARSARSRKPSRSPAQCPLVDTQSVTQRKSLTNDVIDALPTGRSFQNLSVLVPGVQTGARLAGRRRHRRRPLPDAVGARQPRRPDAARHERHAVQQHEQHRRRLQHDAGDQHRHGAGNDGDDERPHRPSSGRAAC